MKTTNWPIEAGQLVAVLPESIDEAPWLGRVKEVKGSNLLIVWMEGSYNSSWRCAKIRKGRKSVEWNDTIPSKTVILSGFTLNKDNRLEKSVVELIKESYSSYF